MEDFEALLAKAEQKVLGYLPKIPGLKIEISLATEKTIPELGIGGNYNKSGNTISIYINPQHKNIQANAANEILKTFAHEYVHASREQKIPWENCTLLEAFVAEGLAQYFEFAVTGEKPLYALALTKKEISMLWKAVNDNLQTTVFDYAAWFFGTRNEKIPRWAGYAIGFWLVENYCKEMNKTVPEIIFTHSEDFKRALVF